MNKVYTRQVTERFLEASDKIIADKQLKQHEYAASVDVTSSNLIRMRNNPDNNVSLESICEMINQYGISPIWILTAAGGMFADSEKAVATNIISARIPAMEKAITEMQKAIKVIKKGIKK